MSKVEVIHGNPPNYEEVAKLFPLSGKEIFTYGDKIFVSNGQPLSEELLAHEYVHVRQQNGDPESWWKKYIEDTNFRFEQELEAHRVEYQAFCKKVKDRNERARFLRTIAQRLSSPLYGSLISLNQASVKIKA